jgi:alkylation response protein AidB-like acyl-CoA dehydrogenase
MDFAFTSDQRALTTAVRELLDKECPAEVARRGDVDAVWPRLAEMGVLGISVAETVGGLGLGYVEVVAVCEEAGRVALPGPLPETYAALAVADASRHSRIVDGSELVTAAAPYAAYADGAAACVVGQDLIEGFTAHVVDSVDPARPLSKVAGEPVTGPAYDVGALATAAYLVGTGRAMIDRAVDYALTREQFGRPIGSFQAVKHRLADALVAVDFARPVVHSAAWALDTGALTLQRDISHAKARATTAALAAAKAALQVHGAIGYTEECDLVVWLRRTWSLAASFGTVAEHRDRIAATVLP